jgi:hypothetical protein
MSTNSVTELTANRLDIRLPDGTSPTPPTILWDSPPREVESHCSFG